jgi:hypothetical protein
LISLNRSLDDISVTDAWAITMSAVNSINSVAMALVLLIIGIVGFTFLTTKAFSRQRQDKLFVFEGQSKEINFDDGSRTS